nr:immunoglobulin light chain junction region [Macaca mulatta]MOX50253.1 immunoglobulin light chain junction region [Macaca mulatta]
CQQGHSNPYSF